MSDAGCGCRRPGFCAFKVALASFNAELTVRVADVKLRKLSVAGRRNVNFKHLTLQMKVRVMEYKVGP